MNENSNAASIPGRRNFVLGLGACALTGCGATAKEPIRSRPATPSDPLSPFRVFANDPSGKWLEHLHAVTRPGGPNVLALSGGGEDGAFGAGALIGWTQSGTRPDFDLVTGVSTGALIAPFAFLGPDYDDDLRRIFTEHDADDIMRLRPLQAVFSDALYDTAPLASLIRTFTPPSFMRAVAARHATGSRLFVVTSELETAQASVWDMGAIAQAKEYDLFRSILRASAALPGLFSPVTLRFDVQGKTISETHLDGGVHMQFLAVPNFAFTTPNRKLAGGHVYVLINNTLNPAPADVSRSALSISQQALMTTSRASALLQVNATQLFARENGLEFSVTSIDPNCGVVYDPSDRFSAAYMNGMYRHGYERAARGALWVTA